MDALKKLIPSLLAVIPLIIAPFVPGISEFVSGNPTLYMALSTVLTVLANVVKSPVAK